MNYLLNIAGVLISLAFFAVASVVLAYFDGCGWRPGLHKRIVICLMSALLLLAIAGSIITAVIYSPTGG